MRNPVITDTMDSRFHGNDKRENGNDKRENGNDKRVKIVKESRSLT